MDPAIRVIDLSKRFPLTSGYGDTLMFWKRREITALDDVSLEVPRAQVFGIVGSSGAGKTTLLKILAGLILPNQGRLLVNGVDLTKGPDKLKNHITYIPSEERSLFWRLTARENLKFFAVLNNVPRKGIQAEIDEALSLVGLDHAADERVSNYSSGMKQRLSIARGLILPSEILLLDEPTRSLDPISTRQIWSLIRDDLVIGHGRTVVVASHSMEDVANVCDRVAILHRGKLLACNTVDGIVNQGENYRIRFLPGTGFDIEDLPHIPGVSSLARGSLNGGNSSSIEFAVQEPEMHIPLVVESLIHTGAKIIEINQVKTTLAERLVVMSEDLH